MLSILLSSARKEDDAFCLDEALFGGCEHLGCCHGNSIVCSPSHGHLRSIHSEVLRDEERSLQPGANSEKMWKPISAEEWERKCEARLERLVSSKNTNSAKKSGGVGIIERSRSRSFVNQWASSFPFGGCEHLGCCHGNSSRVMGTHIRNCVRVCFSSCL